METIKIIIADANPDVLKGVPVSLSKDSSIKVVGLAAESKEFFDMCKAYEPDVVLATPELIEESGISRLRKRDYEYEMKIIAFSGTYRRQKVEKMLAIGLDGYFPYDASDDELVSLIKVVHDGFYCVTCTYVQSVIDTLACGNKLQRQ